MDSPIKIPITEIKTFLSRASAIKPDTHIPISSFVRLKGETDKTSMYKSGQASFIIHEVDAENEEPYDFLIEEKSLSIACENTDAETILFEPAGDVVNITVGNYKQSSPTEDVILFYKFPEFENSFLHTLSGEILDSINAASKYAHAGKDFVTNVCFVHVSNNAVCATDNKKSYYKKFEDELPELVLSLKSCSVLSKFGTVKVKDIEKFYLFNTGSSIYGFSKEEYKAPNFDKAFNTIQEIKRPGFVVKKDSLFSFADKSHKLSSGFIDAIEISDSEGQEIKLDFKSDTVKTSTFSKIEVSKKEGYSEPTSFLVSASILKQVLASLTPETIDVCFATQGKSQFLIFSEDKNQISFIMGMTA